MSSSRSTKHALTNARAFQAALKELEDVKSKLLESQLSTEAMLDSLGEGLVATNERGEITTVNHYALNSLGVTSGELIGAWFPKAIVAVDQHMRPLDQVARPVFRALTTGRTVSEHLYYLRKDGRAMPVFVTVSPILIDNQPVGAIEVFRDLTHEQQLDVAKEEFVSLASHQLRTPATGVMMILSMLAAGDFGQLTEQQQKYLQKAIDNNNRQLQIIEDLLNAARMDAGRLQLNAEPGDLAAVAREAVNDHTPLLASQKQHLYLEAPHELAAIIDTPKIRMVIDNLISNASKYSQTGSNVHVKLAQRADGASVLEVSDEGVGINAADLTRLFTKFTRIDNELSTSAGGTGIGLFLARGIAELHGGTLTVRSEPGRGSTFILILPSQFQGVS